MTRHSPRELARRIERAEGRNPPEAGPIAVVSTVANGGRVEPVGGGTYRFHGGPLDGETRPLSDHARRLFS